MHITLKQLTYCKYNEYIGGYEVTKYGEKAQEKVHKTMKEFKEGDLKSGTSGKKVTSRKQAVAIGLAKARKEGAKVPKQK